MTVIGTVGSAQEGVPNKVRVTIESGDRPHRVDALSDGALVGCCSGARNLERGNGRVRSVSIHGKAQPQRAEDQAKCNW